MIKDKPWRRDRDSNPGYTCVHNGFRDRPVQPLRHPSVCQSEPSLDEALVQEKSF